MPWGRRSASGPPPETRLLAWTHSPAMRLPSDCVALVLGHLGLRDLCRAQSASKAFHALVTSPDFTEHYILHMFVESLKPLLPLPRLRARGTVELMHIILSRMISRRAAELAISVVDVSSVDRALESPSNVLTHSRCFEILRSVSGNAELCQLYCGCALSDPCYWSSSPTSVEGQVEFVTLRLSTPLSVVVGFYAMPYQAFFHPGHPIYGAKEVAIQLLLPQRQRGAATRPALDMQRLPDGFRGADADHTADAYYQSPFFPMANTRAAQFFYLPEPALVLGGEVRMLFRGMHQRQPGNALQLIRDDFYLCMSRVDVVGFPLDNFDLTDGDGGTWDLQRVVGPAAPSRDLPLPSPLPPALLRHL